MGFLNDLTGLSGDVSGMLNQAVGQALQGDNLRDWQHASKLFVGDTYKLAPKYSFLFYVSFLFNEDRGVCQIGDADQRLQTGMLVKSVNLPKFSIDSKVMNAYNRPNIVQNKIKYDSVSMKFHDDNADVMRKFWADYSSNYYRDNDTPLSALPNYSAPHKYAKFESNLIKDWGYTPRAGFNGTYKPANYIKAINIYSLHQKKFTQYVLVNPTIKSFRFGEHTNDGSGIMDVDMTVDYETVLYASGAVGQMVSQGDLTLTLNYDKGPSPLSTLGGGSRSILGPGGLLDSGLDIMSDIENGNIGSAIFKGAKTIYNNRNANIKKMVMGDLSTVAQGMLTGGNPFSKVLVPTLPSLPSFGASNNGGASTAASSVSDSATYNSSGLSSQATSNGSPIGGFLSRLIK